MFQDRFDSPVCNKIYIFNHLESSQSSLRSGFVFANKRNTEGLSCTFDTTPCTMPTFSFERVAKRRDFLVSISKFSCR
jgi:hypothetical protein